MENCLLHKKSNTYCYHITWCGIHAQIYSEYTQDIILQRNNILKEKLSRISIFQIYYHCRKTEPASFMPPCISSVEDGLPSVMHPQEDFSITPNAFPIIFFTAICYLLGYVNYYPFLLIELNKVFINVYKVIQVEKLQLVWLNLLLCSRYCEC